MSQKNSAFNIIPVFTSVSPNMGLAVAIPKSIASLLLRQLHLSRPDMAVANSP